MYLEPEPFAALVAPAIDRLVAGTMAAGRAAGGAEISQRYGGPDATGFLVEFRTRLAGPGGAVTPAGFAAVTRYRERAACLRVLDKQVAHGMIRRGPEGWVQATERGHAFLTEIYAMHATLTAGLWSGAEARIARLAETLGRLLAAAEHTAGEAFAAMAPPYEPDGTPPGVLLLNRLGTLRYHRADAHAAAWRAAGHTARSITDLGPGPERAAIEADTNRRAAPPYAQLSTEERLHLLADLAALPN
ncbi:hypothetical protein [Rhizomonospora bruguierae]|uniref:hypothetical protein n=1 Tax=Rhizomonospora bruguierae TaxID=1581705 RepID=UPI0020BDE564|nr:hypothetical protein [Micromonospora sp. NBRC 107566]